MTSLQIPLEIIQSAFRDVDSSLVRWAGVEGQREGTGVLAVLCSLAAVWITWKFLLMCLESLKLRRMSRTVPSIRRVLGLTVGGPRMPWGSIWWLWVLGESNTLVEAAV